MQYSLKIECSWCLFSYKELFISTIYSIKANGYFLMYKEVVLKLSHTCSKIVIIRSKKVTRSVIQTLSCAEVAHKGVPNFTWPALYQKLSYFETSSIYGNIFYIEVHIQIYSGC